MNTNHIIQSENSSTGVTVILNYDQDRAMVTYPGAMEELCMADIDFDFLATAKHLHVSSIFLQPALLKDLPLIMEKAKTLGLTISIDTQGDPAGTWDLSLPDLLPSVDFFMPNMAELLMLTGTVSLEKGIEKIGHIAPNITLVLKNGVQGVFSWRNGRVIHQPAFLNTETVDCIGAGDSFNAGFIHAFLTGNTLESCLEYGNLMGAVSTTKPGGTGAFESREAVEKIAAENFGVLN